MSDTYMIEKAKRFVMNKGLIRQSTPPRPNEPFYDFFIEAMMESQNIGIGDDVLVVDTKSNAIEGQIIEDPRVELCGLILLTSGKKVWASRKNVKYVPFRDIVSVELIRKASKDFNILDVNTNYTKLSNTTYEDNDYDDAFVRYFRTTNAGLNYTDVYSLCIHSSLYCPFTNADVVKGKMMLITKDDDVRVLSDLRIKHLCPNKDYYSLCERAPYAEYVLIPFASKAEMDNVKCIATFWTVLIDDVPVHTLEMTHPTFVENGKRIYNVQQESTFLDVYNEGLSTPSVFSGRLYSKYDTVSVILNEDMIDVIMGKDDEIESIMLDIILASHDGSLTNILMSLCGDTQTIKYIEAYKASCVVKGSYRTTDVPEMSIEWYDSIRKKLSFQRLFKQRAAI